ncbi:ParB/RepB/Spo0J family partition protein [Desulfovibrio sp. OttesenSCG-928-G15]|nr:ParB/RepB/Spo0J family partition protein [Desulfovibrio sp. OttesenSCG-928-G15]
MATIIKEISPSAFSEFEVRELPLNLIEADEQQPRKEFIQTEIDELAASIKQFGQMQPIIVICGPNNKYQIVDGERRWRACSQLKASELDGADANGMYKYGFIKAIYADSATRVQKILSNIARKEYNPMETAKALSILKEELGENASDKRVANLVGKSRSLIAEYNSLLLLPKSIQDAAEINSCVPLRQLKKLAVRKLSDSEKITEYDRLVKEATNLPNKSKGDGSKKMSKEARTVLAAQSRLNKLQDAFTSIDPHNIPSEEKEPLKESLIKTIETAQSLLTKLSG